MVTTEIRKITVIRTSFESLLDKQELKTKVSTRWFLILKEYLTYTKSP